MKTFKDTLKNIVTEILSYHTNSNKKFYFKNSITDDDGFIQITIPAGAYEIEALDNKKRIITDKKYHTSDDYPFTIKPNFSTLGRL